MMFSKLGPGETRTINDRNICDVTHVSGQYQTEIERGSLWVAGTGNFVLDKTTILSSATAAMGGFTSVGGNFGGMVIHNYALQQSEKITASFKTDAPGQLVYIDGCSNSNLVAPQRNGDPCLNYLYFPMGIEQTFHTHPSVRIGYVTGGKGFAWINENGQNKKLELNEGDVFVLERHCIHRFSTEDSHMSLVAYHPDSEDGPRDEANPMKTRTYIER